MRLKIIVSDSVDPYWNVAVENYLVSLYATDVVTMYLWRNRRTVVIGRNQNPFSECDVNQLLADGGRLMRRTTGGGAVYHDDGNLNFSFIAPYDLYDQSRQFEVIRRTIATYGLECETSGRNDIMVTVDGQPRKFSGNAFSKGRYQRLHHGTLLIKGNIDDLRRYLKVKPSKLQKHGVASVKSRVVNLSELADVTSDNIVAPLCAAFESVYDGTAEIMDFRKLVAEPEVERLHYLFSSDDWLYGNWRLFTASKTASFEWGEVDLRLVVDEQKGIIIDVDIATDSLDVSIVEDTRHLLRGASTSTPPHTDDPVLQDIVSLVYNT